MPNGWVAFFCALHIAVFFMLALFFVSHHFVDVEAYQLAKAEGQTDALKLAYDSGVLELVSVSLTVLGVSIGVFAVLGFWIYGHVVDRAAKQETKEIAPQIIGQILQDEPALWLKVVRENPLMFKSAIQDALGEENMGMASPSRNFGDQIAQNLDDLGGENVDN